MADLTSIGNFRDLGGLPCKDGQTTKSSVLFRSARTTTATPEDVVELRNILYINSIVDLRGKRKQDEPEYPVDVVYPERDPGCTLSASGNVSKELPGRFRFKFINRAVRNLVLKKVGVFKGLCIFAAFLFAKVMKLQSCIWGPFVSEALRKWIVGLGIRVNLAALKLCLDQRGSRMEDLYYLILTHNKKEVARALEFCANPTNQPVLFHCTSGKDRTGILSALLLTAVGVSRERVLQEYHLSHPYCMTEHHVQQVLNLPEMPMELLKDDEYYQMLFGAVPTSLERCFEKIEAEYGSITNYLDAIGCGAEYRTRLAQTFVN